MSLLVDKEAVMQDVMHAINKHYAGYEQNISDMESIIKQLPMVKNLIKENEELRRRLESENIHLDVNEKCFSVDVDEDMNKYYEDNDTNRAVVSDDENMSDIITTKMVHTGIGAVGIASGSHTYFNDEGSEAGSQPEALEGVSEAGSQPETEASEAGASESDNGGIGVTTPEAASPEEEEEEEASEAEGDMGSGVTTPEEDEEEEDEEVFEVTIGDSVYFTTNETNGELYECTIEGDVGDVVGSYVNGKPVFS